MFSLGMASNGMVGTLYQDPSKLRQKRWHGKTVIVETPEL